MTFRSRLFATVALPVLSTSLVTTPALADALMKPFEVAQEDTDTQQLSEEEILRQREEEARRAAEEERAADEAQQEADQQAAEEAERAAEQERAAEEAAQEAERLAEEERAAEEAERAAEQDRAAEDAAREAERAAEEQRAAEQEAERAAEQERAAEDAAQEAERLAEEERAAEQDRAADDAAREAERAAEEQRAAEEEQAGEAPAQDEPETRAGEPAAEEDPAVAGEEAPPAGEGDPATAGTQEAPAGEPVPEIVDTLSEEEKQEIAEDPSQTDETVVLPVENGAAVLDSDKDADNAGGQRSREERRRQREELRAQEEATPLPDTDATAQAEIPEDLKAELPQRIEAALNEEGERAREAPTFAVPETTNIINNTVINNTVINNNTTVNNTVTEVQVRERIDNRTVLSVGDRLLVRSDDRPRLRRDSEEVYYDNLARGRVRETIVRPGGTRIVTIYNRYGDILQRSRIDRDGREHLLVYAPEQEERRRPALVDVGYELPPMRLRIPVTEYIIDTSSDPDRDYYDFLSEPPVERVERVYTIDEVKYSARLRDKVRRIDLDTITFASGSAEVPMSQARTLRSVAEAMQRILDRDPGETFLIEGHTDAVGSDQSNLVLSDRRAESVATLLTDVYGIPPENLVTQGYGERFLKVRTEAAEQQNRRVTIRRVTTLVRPLAQAN